jgi:hypothetical protein
MQRYGLVEWWSCYLRAHAATWQAHATPALTGQKALDAADAKGPDAFTCSSFPSAPYWTVDTVAPEALPWTEPLPYAPAGCVVPAYWGS